MVSMTPLRNGKRSESPISRNRGFSIVEFAIGLALLALMVGLGLPSFGQWMGNAALRSTAESIMAGLQTARAEAVRRNVAVTFRMSPDADTLWEVTDANGRIQSAAKQGGTIASSVTTKSTPAAIGGVTFNGLGRVAHLLYADGNWTNWVSRYGDKISIAIDLPPNVMRAADTRDLVVEIRQWGGMRMCDPNLAVTYAQSCRTL